MLMTCCAYSCTQCGVHTQYMLLTHADALLCLQLHTVRSRFFAPVNFHLSDPRAVFKLLSLFYFRQFIHPVLTLPTYIFNCSLQSQSQHFLLLKFLSRVYSCPPCWDLQLHRSVVLSAACNLPFAFRVPLVRTKEK